MKKLMNILFLSCIKATELMEKKLLFQISWIEKLQLNAHKMMCTACTRYEKQSGIIESGIVSLLKKEPTADDVEKLKKMIIKKIENYNK
jgi:hypothetical protein